MKILFAGGGTGGHFYPIIAVARALRKIADEKRILKLELFFMSDSPYDKKMLQLEDIKYKYAPAGKVRQYFSILNITDTIKTILGIIKAIWSIFLNIPDVIFAKGGYASFPALFAARFFKIPVVIHESDAVPGKVNTWAAKFSRRIAISFPQSAKYFEDETKIALTGAPIRSQILGGSKEDALSQFKLKGDTPTILILGGSQGAQKINDTIVDILPELLKDYQIIHQCGKANFEDVKNRSDVILEKKEFKERYHLFGFLNESQLRNASNIATIVVSRPGGNAIFEIAAWGLPSILIPIPQSAQDHQLRNAYSYSRAGAAIVIEQSNLTPHILLFEIKKLLEDEGQRRAMIKATTTFARINAAEIIARELIDLALEHA